MIPLVDLKAQYVTIKPEIDAAMQAVVESTACINGPQVRSCEESFAAFCGVQHAIGVQSGTSARHLALRACDIGPGDEVIVPSMTFIATAEMDPILEVARRHGVRVIEDAAQAHGAEYRGRRAGTLGDVTTFSFYPGKNLGAFGDAGAVVTNDEGIAEEVRLLRNHGRRSKYTHEREGFNYRLDTLQAAILEAKLRHLEKWNAARRRNADLYRQLLAGLPLELPYEAPHVRSAYHLFVIRVERRDEVLAYLKANGVGAGVHYPLPLHMQPAYDYLEYQPDDLPVSRAAGETVLSLPMYPELTKAQVEQVVGTLNEALGGGE